MSGAKNVLHRSEEKMGRDELATFLRHLADRVESGTVTLSGGAEDLTLEVAQQVELELKYQTRTKANNTKYELELEIQWGEGSTGVNVK